MNTLIEQFLMEAFQSETISHQSFVGLWNTERYQNQASNVANKQKTCYGVFCEENYETVSKIIDDTPGNVNNKRQSRIKKKLSEMWSELKNSKNPEDMERMERIKHVTKNNSKKATNKKQKGDCKKRANPYLIFCQEHRDNIRNELPSKEGFTYQDVVKELGRRWQVLICSAEAENMALVEEYKQKAIRKTNDTQNTQHASC
tara:strand:+ start:2974 stop:3579 length:606 start_codon:yes stop_codon:yes gene_type:complete